MSSATALEGGGAPKKAVHVKWAGKTIALGTFPSSEADEKCARAKALTRAWRSTMRPKPSREWVMIELERLGVRVVSGRLGRKLGDGEEEEGLPRGMAGLEAPLTSGVTDRKNSIGWSASDDFDSLLKHRSNSIGFNRSNSLGFGSVDDPSRRPFVGGGTAAAYEAARADHYGSLGAQKGRADGHSSSLGMGGGSGIGMSVNPNQHYEMLKLHHMNLLNEIQETTLMMNLYQQQQLQQQQQQLQQQEASAAGLDSYGRVGAGGAFARTSLGGMDSIGSNRASIGLGTIPDRSDELMAAKEQQQILEERLQKIKDDIARKQKEAETLEEQSVKRKAGGDKKGKAEDPKSKRIKKEAMDGDGDDDDDDDEEENDDGDDDEDDDDDDDEDDDDEKNEEKGTTSKGVGV